MPDTNRTDEFLAGLNNQHEEHLKGFVETQVAVVGLWAAMTVREQYLRNKLGPAGYERHSIMVTAAWGIASLIGATLFFLAGVTGWHGAVLTPCLWGAVFLALVSLHFIRNARLRHIRLNQWRGDGG